MRSSRKPVGAETEHGNELRQSGGPAGKIGVARIRTVDVRAEGAARALRILREAELIQANLLRVRADPGNRSRRSGHQGIARPSSPRHGSAKLVRLRGVAIRLLVEKLPEAPGRLDPVGG